MRANRLFVPLLLVTALAGWTRGVEGLPETAPASPSRPDSASEPRPYWRQGLLKRIWFDQVPLLVTWWPAELARPEFSGPLAASSLLAASSDWGEDGGLDVSMERWIHQSCGGGCTSASNALTTLGNWPVLAAGMGIAWWAGARAGNERLAEASSLGLEALATSGLWNEALKHLTARARPPGDSLGSFWNYGPSPSGQELGSFPSGHAQMAFTVAAVYAGVYRDRPSVAWLAYGTASLIALSRVALGRHFPSDVVVGGILGASIGRFTVARAHGDPRGGRMLSALGAWRPAIDPDRGIYALYWTRRW